MIISFTGNRTIHRKEITGAPIQPKDRCESGKIDKVLKLKKSINEETVSSLFSSSLQDDPSLNLCLVD